MPFKKWTVRPFEYWTNGCHLVFLCNGQVFRSPLQCLSFISADNMATALTIASLNCLGELFKSCGVFLRKSLHKNVQCILIGLCTEVQAEKGIKTSFLNFKASGARTALYNTLLEVVLGSHPKWPAPTQYALKIFEQGENFNSKI